MASLKEHDTPDPAEPVTVEPVPPPATAAERFRRWLTRVLFGPPPSPRRAPNEDDV